MDYRTHGSPGVRAEEGYIPLRPAGAGVSSKLNLLPRINSWLYGAVLWVLFLGLSPLAHGFAGSNLGEPLNLFVPDNDSFDWGDQYDFNFSVMRSSFNTLNEAAIRSLVGDVVSSSSGTAYATIQPSAVDTNKIKVGAVDTNRLGPDAVTTVKIYDLAVTLAKLASASVDTTKLVTGAVDTNRLGQSAVTTDKIATGAVDTTKLAVGSVDTNRLNNDAVTSAKILNETISPTDIAASAVITAKIADGAVDTTKLGSGAVGSSQLQNSAVLTANIASAAVDTTKLGSGAVGQSQLAASAVNTNNIVTASIDTTKIQNGAIDTSKLKPPITAAGSCTSCNISWGIDGRLNAASTGSGADVVFVSTFTYIPVVTTTQTSFAIAFATTTVTYTGTYDVTCWFSGSLRNNAGDNISVSFLVGGTPVWSSYTAAIGFTSQFAATADVYYNLSGFARIPKALVAGSTAIAWTMRAGSGTTDTTHANAKGFFYCSEGY